MKYSLRTLMLFVTLVCVVLGGMAARVEYLRRWAEFHEGEARRAVTRVGPVLGVPLGRMVNHPSEPGDWLLVRTTLFVCDGKKVLFTNKDASMKELPNAARHFKLAETYRLNAYRPWVIVD